MRQLSAFCHKAARATITRQAAAKERRQATQNAGKSVLVFLGACLAFAEAGLAAIAQLAGASGTLLAAFTPAALGMVLPTLPLMDKWNPGFLTIAGGQASGLATLHEIARSRPDVLTPEVLASLMDGRGSWASRVGSSHQPRRAPGQGTGAIQLQIGAKESR